jgi:hypothetical protein
MHILKGFSLCNYLGITGKTNINFFLCCLKEIEIGHELKKKLSVACIALLVASLNLVNSGTTSSFSCSKGS